MTALYDVIRMVALLMVLLTGVGIIVLIAALVLTRQLISQVPSGIIRHQWRGMGFLILSFILGYFGFILAERSEPMPGSELIVPTVFLFSSIFMWFAIWLALQTTVDLRQMRILQEQSITDPLLGVYNRRHLEKQLVAHFERAKRYGLSLSVLMMDVDHFKSINETFQHQAGDAVLRHIGYLVSQTVRDTDIVARFGGDELVILAPETSVESAAALAERLRSRIGAQNFLFANKPEKVYEIPLTVSIGVASMTGDETTASQLLQKADEALHRAKQDGKNRVSVYSPSSP